VNSQQKEKGWRDVLLCVIPLAIGFISTFIGIADSTHKVLALWAGVGAVVAFLFFVLFLAEWYIWREKKERRKFRIAFVALSAAVVVAGFFWQSRIDNPPPPRSPWLTLTDQQKRGFITVLASQTETRERIKIGCPLGNEEICISTTPFIEFFKRGHFVVENDRIDRIIPGKPIAGVVLFKYGHADKFDPQDPDQGKWMRYSESLQTVKKAFASVGIKTTTVADEGLPHDVIGVFFGLEPKP
jgi:amino acid transporter